MKAFNLILITALLVFIASDWYIGHWAGRGISIMLTFLSYIVIATQLDTRRLNNSKTKKWPFPTTKEGNE